MDTFEKIRALLAEQLDIDPEKITPDSDIMSDFEADSLDIVDMVMTLEDEFGIEVPVLAHRITLTAEATFAGNTPEQMIGQMSINCVNLPISSYS